MEPLDVVSTTYLTCLLDVVGAYAGTTPTARALEDATPVARVDDDPLATLVRFGEERVWGSSLLIADEGAVLGAADGAVADAADWLGELNNQLVGRLKNRLLRSGIGLQVSPPIPVVGFVKGRRGTAGWEVEWPGGRLTGILGLTVAPGIVLVSDPTVEVVEEGTLCLF